MKKTICSVCNRAALSFLVTNDGKDFYMCHHCGEVFEYLPEKDEVKRVKE
jgi:uncharacterized C2H2 Zn-finger protein